MMHGAELGPLMRRLYGLHLVEAQPVAAIGMFLLAPDQPMPLVVDPACTELFAEAAGGMPAVAIVHVVRFVASEGGNAHFPVLVLHDTLRTLDT